MLQYMHDIMVNMSGISARDEATGNWIKDPAPNNQAYKGRYEPEGEGGFFMGEDGRMVKYNAVVWLQKPVNGVIPVGSNVQVIKDGKLLATGNVSRFFEGTFNAKIWL